MGLEEPIGFRMRSYENHTYLTDWETEACLELDLGFGDTWSL